MGTARTQQGLCDGSWWRDVRRGCEVRDFTVALDGTEAVRMTNEAGNDELRRRGLVPLDPSGELVGWAIAWRNTCGGSWLQEGTLTRP